MTAGRARLPAATQCAKLWQASRAPRVRKTVARAPLAETASAAWESPASCAKAIVENAIPCAATGCAKKLSANRVPTAPRTAARARLNAATGLVVLGKTAFRAPATVARATRAETGSARRPKTFSLAPRTAGARVETEFASQASRASARKTARYALRKPASSAETIARCSRPAEACSALPQPSNFLAS